MCGYCGYVDYNNNISDKSIISNMVETLKKRGPNFQDIYLDKNIALGHTRLSIIDVKFGNQPMTKLHNNNSYTICYNGEIYNSKEIRDDLIKKGIQFETTCDTEVVLSSYIIFGEECLKYLNGIFSFVIYDKTKNLLFFARDRLGIKPLFYTISNSNFVFGSEIKAILKNPSVKRVLNKEGIMELFGLGPAHSPGNTYFKGIKEIKAGHYAIFKNNQLNTYKYWDLETKNCMESEEEAISEIHYLLKDACTRQLVSDVGVCTMLSGGLDSSILTKIANDNLNELTTFSIDFKGNDKDFVANDYQMTKDSDYVKIMKDYLNTNHKTIEIEHTRLFELLNDALIARDMPGMADIDSSMFAFCENISKNGFKVCISGECSDEIFGGYPWFYKQHLVNHTGFPWALSENLRENLLRNGILSKGDITNYINSCISDTLQNVNYTNTSDKFENRFRDINYLTIKYFMNTLVERTDRMSMANSLEVRVPFADHRIFEYVYNLPAKMKLGLSKSSNPTEKYLLRKAFENELPENIVYRKKSPFPKTYDLKYLSLVEQNMLDILNNKNSRIHELINKDFVLDMIKIHGENLKENLFGQLMTYPQTLAFLIQINNWLEMYDISIEL